MGHYASEMMEDKDPSPTRGIDFSAIRLEEGRNLSSVNAELLENLAALEDQVSVLQKATQMFTRNRDTVEENGMGDPKSTFPPNLSDVAREHWIISNRISALAQKIQEMNRNIDS